MLGARVKAPHPHPGLRAVYHSSVAAPPLSDRPGTLIQAGTLAVLALGVRLWLAPRFFGWEEGDYGNVMMIREVVESGFTWFRPSHMPGWYSAAAVPQLLGLDPRAAGLLVTMASSVVSVVVAALVARRIAGPAAAWLVGGWLALQPEMALYGASTLRSPLFVCLGMLGLWAVVRGRGGGFGWTAAAFLTRMEAAVVYFGPACWAWLRARRPLVLPGAVLVGVVAGWQLYITVGHGETGPFWAGPATQNEVPVDGLGAWADRGGRTSAALLLWTLPRKIGWIWLALAGLGGVAALRGQGRFGGRVTLAYAAAALGFWMAEGFLAQHDPNHNLYWVWMLPVVPPLALLAGLGWSAIDDHLRGLPQAVRAGALGLVFAAALPTFAAEGRYQAERAADWYRPQLDLATWLEDNASPDAGLVVASIPEVWLQRRPSTLRVTAWWVLPQELRGASREQFGAWLERERIDYLMWFAEEWTEAPAIAPYLAAGAPVRAGGVSIEPVDREDGYGWILYVVERPGSPAPPQPPAFGQGVRGAGWR